MSLDTEKQKVIGKIRATVELTIYENDRIPTEPEFMDFVYEEGTIIPGYHPEGARIGTIRRNCKAISAEFIPTQEREI